MFCVVCRVRERHGEAYGPRVHLGAPSQVDFLNTTGASVDCLAYGNPSPRVRWRLRDGSPRGQRARTPADPAQRHPGAVALQAGALQAGRARGRVPVRGGQRRGHRAQQGRARQGEVSSSHRHA
ncbi:hypothetical protein CEXT_251031 [Caerostris extrusa]|uniref:Uncharacterized protein n=1 Tax=Caerostris extrusa TaxID=172846 RepID=A0AAV4M3T6_CAEEX|nr:hypothetical protein CEXT_251031 [Caerostris extrusa]